MPKDNTKEVVRIMVTEREKCCCTLSHLSWVAGSKRSCHVIQKSSGRTMFIGLGPGSRRKSRWYAGLGGLI